MTIGSFYTILIFFSVCVGLQWYYMPNLFGVAGTIVSVVSVVLCTRAVSQGRLPLFILFFLSSAGFAKSFMDDLEYSLIITGLAGVMTVTIVAMLGTIKLQPGTGKLDLNKEAVADNSNDIWIAKLINSLIYSRANFERNSAINARDTAISERNSAISERDMALSERNSAISERDKALSERNSAISERDKALSERNSAISERDKALSERNSAINAKKTVQKNVDAQIAIINDLENRLGKIKDEKDIAVEEYMKTIDSLNSKIMEMENNIGELQSQVKASQDAQEEWKAKYEDARMNIEQMQQILLEANV